MRWRKITINTTTEAEELLVLMLYELGVEGVEIDDDVPLSEEDIRKQFIDLLPDMPEPDGTARISFYLHEEDPGDKAAKSFREPGLSDTADNSYAISDRIWSAEDIEELLSNVRARLEDLKKHTDIGEGTIEIGATEDTDWQDNWKKFFEPILIDDILIVPSWLDGYSEHADAESGKAKKIVIDPGTAFGTGSHETTRLCVSALSGAVKKGSRVLDLGAGSGILGMAAVRLGAELVTAVDIDPACRKVIEDNISMNGISAENFVTVIGNVLSDGKTAQRIREASDIYDVAVANILAPVIISLASPGICDSFVRKGGIFITSGILDIKEKEVIEAFEANPAWTDVRAVRMGEWSAVTAVRA